MKLLLSSTNHSLNSYDVLLYQSGSETSGGLSSIGKSNGKLTFIFTFVFIYLCDLKGAIKKEVQVKHFLYLSENKYYLVSEA